jgi:hypothetical protein
MCFFPKVASAPKLLDLNRSAKRRNPASQHYP